MTNTLLISTGKVQPVKNERVLELLLARKKDKAANKTATLTKEKQLYIYFLTYDHINACVCV